MKDAKDLESQIFTEQIKLLFRQYPLSAASGMLVTLTVVAMLWGMVPDAILLAWMVAQNLCLVSGFILVARYNSLSSNVKNPLKWYRAYLVVITLVGFLWGSLIHFSYFDLSSGHQNFLIITTVGLASAALVLALPILTAYYAYLSLALVPLIIWFFNQDQTILTVLGILSILYFGLLIFAGRNLNIHFVNNIRLRLEKAVLVDRVKNLNESLEQRVAEKTSALSESEERFDLAMQGANDGLWDWDIQNQSSYFSPRWKSMLGFGESDISDSPREWQRRIHSDDRRQVLTLIQTHLEGKTESYESIHRVRHKDGHYLWVLDRGRAVYDEKGIAQRMVGTQVDISEHKNLEEKIKSANIQLKHEIKERLIAQEELAHLAMHDPLTGLPNRTLFYEQLQVAIRRAELEDDAIAVLLVDLDNFKQVNDTLGHPFGDRLLVEVSKRLNSIVNKNYFLSRFGGDEFVVILEGCSDNFIIDAYSKEIIDLMSLPFLLDNQEIRIGCSIGITLFPDDGKGADQLIRDADIAMYHAKDQGRNMFKYYTAEMDKKITERVKLKNLLHGALERDEFEVHYQPQVGVKSNQVTGLEALLRWTPQDGEAISPDKFIPLLEESGLIAKVGDWVLRQACEQAKYLQNNGLPDLVMAVNFSPRQFLQENLASEVEAVLIETGLQAQYLEVEITENIFMEDLDLIKITMLRLRDMGVKITLDDFGTGFSSLGYLKKYPINGVKIDKEFINDITNNNDSRELVAAIIAMSDGLNLDRLVAEGVEDESQLKYLRKLGCPTYQGFLFSKPLSVDALRALLLKGPRRISLSVKN